jgi:hypothetical protein
MIPNIVTLAQAGGQQSAVPVRVVPSVDVAAPAVVPAARQSAVGAYFGLFKACGCGHSSAWHGGAFGDAWRAGEQVRGACEADDEVSKGSCRCRRFHDPEVAS